MILPIKQFKVDLLEVFVYKTREEMGLAAYESYKKRILSVLEKQSKVRAIFAAAPSQNDFLNAMVADDGIDFSRITGFHMDEYMGLGTEAPQNFGNFLKKSIFSKKPFAEVNYVKSDALDIEAECLRYEALLRVAPIDIVSMGIGENGHIAFNDPHEANFNDDRWVKRTSLDNISRQQQVNDGEFPDIEAVPKQALTLTIPALMKCTSVVCIVPGERKAKAVRNTLRNEISEQCPASILRRHPDAALYLDAKAAKYML